MFEPFQSEFQGGSGLGMAIVYQIVQAHDGKVFVRSVPGQGTVVEMRLRRTNASADAWLGVRPQQQKHPVANATSVPKASAAAAGGSLNHG